jgi:hypothetical protein
MLVTALLLTLAQAPSCVNSNGTSVCGYDCKGESGKVKCAQTPEGVCATSGGNVGCFDPPNAVRAVFSPLPKPSCKAADGKVVCGYNCVQGESGVECAKTPRGVCEAKYGKVVCFDPPPEVYAVYGAGAPAPSCEARDGKVVCGYGCGYGGGEVQCAKTPAGACIERGGKVSCMDPPGRALCAGGTTMAKATCKAEAGKLACGYDCQSFGGDLKCAQTPAGKCTATASGTTCFDPPSEGGAQSCLSVLGASYAP